MNELVVEEIDCICVFVRMLSELMQLLTLPTFLFRLADAYRLTTESNPMGIVLRPRHLQLMVDSIPGIGPV